MSRLRHTIACHGSIDAEREREIFPSAPVRADPFDEPAEEADSTIWDGPSVGLTMFAIVIMALVL